MTKQKLAALDEHLIRFLDGSELERKVGLAVECATVDDDGTPHAALLSAGEVLALDAETLRLALWDGSTTTRNLRERGRALLSVVIDGAFYWIQIRANAVDGGADRGLQFFTAAVTAVQRDTVDYARLTSGVTYELIHPDGELVRWRRRHDALREVDGGTDSGL